MISRITSPDNEKVKFVRSLLAKKNRYEERAFLVEGVRLVEEAVVADAKLQTVLFEPDALSRTERGSALLEKLGGRAIPVTERVLKTVSDTMTPQGIVAAVSFPEEPSRTEGQLLLILDGLRDPGNLGTILRTAVAAGVKTIITSGDTADPFSPKVVRAAMGAHFRLGLLMDKSWAQINELAQGRTVFLAAARTGRPYYDVNWTELSAVIVSSEAHGASEEAKQVATNLVTIPMAESSESLNAAVAAGVILFEAFRQQTNYTV